MTESISQMLNETARSGSDRSPASGTASQVGRVSANGESADMVFIVDADGKILYVNRALPGVAQDDVPGTAIYDYVLPNHHAAIRTGLEEAFRSGLPRGFEVLGMAHRSSTEWYDCRVVPTKRGEKIVSATIIARDVTQRKRTEGELKRELDHLKDQLAEREQSLQKAKDALKGRTNAMVKREFALARFRELLDHSGEAIFVAEADGGQVVDANDIACRWIGMEHAQVITKTLAQLNLLFPVQVPKDEFGNHVTETRDLRRPRFYKGEHRRQNGSTFPVDVGITHHQFGETEYVLLVARDAKARQRVEEQLRESEDKYRALFELSRDAIYLSNRDGTVAEANDAAVELFGYSHAELAGFEARRLYKKTSDIRAFQSEVAKHGFVRDMEVELVNRAGTGFVGLLTATLRHAGDRGVLGYQCVIREKTVHQKPAAPPSRQSMEEAEARGHGLVLLVDGEAGARGEAKHVLELAGIRVLSSESLAEGLVIFRARSSEIGAVLLAGHPNDILEDSAFTEIRRLAPNTRVVLLTADESEQSIVEHLAAAGLTGIIKKPFHPLALIQQVRQAVEAGQKRGEAARRPRLWRREPRDTDVVELDEEQPE
jgi:PAS domain S-box-containing protein